MAKKNPFRYLVLSMASSDPGDSDIVGFTLETEVAEFVYWQARGGAHKLIVFMANPTDLDIGKALWSPEDEIGGDRLREFANQNALRWKR